MTCELPHVIFPFIKVKGAFLQEGEMHFNIEVML
ncbi:hypothetical protein QFZ87_001049 [Bacillus sp. SLBN-46]|nr:hypothetical protein [Bacillus sp. SLBN-46]